MRVLEEKYSWNPIETVPLEVDVMLEVTDGHGEPYRLRKRAAPMRCGMADASSP
jgi:hypothetical protein